MRRRRDHAGIAWHEKGGEGRREKKDDHADAGQDGEGKLGAESPNARRALDIAGSDILARQDRDRHRKAEAGMITTCRILEPTP